MGISTFIDFMFEPFISPETKRKIIYSLCLDSRISSSTSDFLNLIIDSGRIYSLTNITSEINILSSAAKGTQETKVKTSINLCEELLYSIAKYIVKLSKNKSIKIKSIINTYL